MSKPKAIFSWSGGKDSAYGLHKVLSEGTYDVKYLLTTVNDTFGRISMHGIREELLERQLACIGIPLIKARVSEGTNAEYEHRMEEVLLKAKTEGIEQVIFGDIFLDDLRDYREKNLARVGMNAVFPLWKLNTGGLIRDFITQGFRTVICCTNDAFLGEEWLGREIDMNFVNGLPAHVDPCGENGEYHSFCYGGPLFPKPLQFTRGEVVFRPLEPSADPGSQQPGPVTRGFWYIDLIPA